MKNLLNLIALLAICASSFAQPKDKLSTPDLVYFELQGHVKSCINTFSTDGEKFSQDPINYDRNGKLIAPSEGVLEYNDDGEVIRYGDDPMETDWENGRPNRCWGANMEYQYIYDSKGLLFAVKSYDETTTYSYQEFDKHGNWIKRTNTSPEEVSIQTRTITYYDDEAQAEGGKAQAEGDHARGPEEHQFPRFDNKTFTAEQQPFADLSQKIWDMMAAKDTEGLKQIFHPNCEFVHMGGYWGTDDELQTIGSGMIWYKHAEVYGVDVKKVNDTNVAVYSTIVLDAEVGGQTTSHPFFVSQMFIKEDGTWKLASFVFTTRMFGPGVQMEH